MIIREYRESDCKQAAELFLCTVHTVNAKDYSAEQLDAWAPKSMDLEAFNRSLLLHFSLVALKGGAVIGFGDIDESGYLDRLYVHRDYQGRGVASELCRRLESRYKVKKIVTHASITAKPFFEKRGYKALKRQEVERRGVLLTNYVMEKILT